MWAFHLVPRWCRDASEALPFHLCGIAGIGTRSRVTPWVGSSTEWWVLVWRVRMGPPDVPRRSCRVHAVVISRSCRAGRGGSSGNPTPVRRVSVTPARMGTEVMCPISQPCREFQEMTPTVPGARSVPRWPGSERRCSGRPSSSVSVRWTRSARPAWHRGRDGALRSPRDPCESCHCHVACGAGCRWRRVASGPTAGWTEGDRCHHGSWTDRAAGPHAQPSRRCLLAPRSATWGRSAGVGCTPCPWGRRPGLDPHRPLRPPARGSAGLDQGRSRYTGGLRAVIPLRWRHATLDGLVALVRERTDRRA